MTTKKVGDIQEFWIHQPPELSPRCLEWVDRIRCGWRRNRRIKSMGYYSAAEFYGVFIWEYLNVLLPLLRECDP